jgi:hypothetical protein
MTAREAFARLAYEDAGLNALGFTEERVWQSNAIDSPYPNTPFIVVSVDLEEQIFGTTGPVTMSYWVHVPRAVVRDYGIIDLAIAQLKDLMRNLEPKVGSDGWILTGGKWVDTSRDLTDPTFNTLVRYVTFRCAAHNIVTP